MIEDKTIELMVSAARWTVCSSARRAPGGPAHLSVRREAGPWPFPAVSAGTWAPRLPWPGARRGFFGSLEISAGAGPAPSCPSVLPPPVLSPGPSLERPSLANAVALAHTHSRSLFIFLLCFFGPGLHSSCKPHLGRVGWWWEGVGGRSVRASGLRVPVGVSAPAPQQSRAV